MDDKPSVEQLVSVYTKIYTKREEEERVWKAREAELTEQLDLIKRELLDICKENGVKSLRTKAGTLIRTVTTRYWTNDWEHFHKFMLDNQAPDLLEKRIHQSNMKQFLEENPELLPAGLNMDSEYTITVRRSKS
jgi:ATP-dependent Lon protease